MKRKLTHPLIISLLFIFQTSFSFSQEYPIISIDPWTIRAGEKSTYYKMVDWDSSPYKEFTYWKRSGPEAWDITEYTNFRMLFPKGYDQLANDGKKYPMIVFLHGAGESGVAWTGHFDYVNGYKETPPEPEKIDNNDHQLLYGGHEFLAARNRSPKDPRAFPGFFLFPQIPYNGSWSGEFRDPISSYNRQVIELVELLISKYKIDPNRIYVLGLSNGARGVWDLINRRPDLFAAGISMSGLGDRELMAQPLAHFPIWIFQGEEDTNPAPAGTYQIVNALEEEGGTPRLTVYEDLGHGVWNRAFTEPDYFSWLLSKSKLTVHVFYGKTNFKTLDGVKVKLGISPGFINYQWRRDGEIITNSNANNFLVREPGAYQVRFQREEEWTAWSDPVYITSEEKKVPDTNIAYRINIGSSSIIDDPIDWEADSDTKPSTYLTKNSSESILQFETFSGVNLTEAPDAIFRSVRQGNSSDNSMHYSFPLQGKSKVILYFADPSHEGNERVFNIIIEGKTVTNNFNIRKEAGAGAAKKTYEVTVTDGNLDVAFQSVKGKPILSGIEIKETNGLTGIKNQKDFPILAYPNPFTDLLTITLSENNIKVKNISIADLRGKILFKKDANLENHKILLDSEVYHLPSGLYLLHINFKNGNQKILKIIKQ